MADEPQPQPPRREPIPRWKLILWGVIAVYAVIFLLVNSGRSKVHFVFYTVETRQIWLILLSMGLGAVLASILPRWWRNRRK
ncbi:LapA family protein [Gaiella sp.]|uniref:LapA family protein n=1 Tax=Gaiella sp. TaxID=2663207 RepID=UPI002E34B756|nr:LapA family protein [Gaiella sp.]HEX5585605.1 LapA family protein [Gaiella sp.]